MEQIYRLRLAKREVPGVAGALASHFVVMIPPPPGMIEDELYRLNEGSHLQARQRNTSNHPISHLELGYGNITDGALLEVAANIASELIYRWGEPRVDVDPEIREITSRSEVS